MNRGFSRCSERFRVPHTFRTPEHIPNISPNFRTYSKDRALWATFGKLMTPGLPCLVCGLPVGCALKILICAFDLDGIAACPSPRYGRFGIQNLPYLGDRCSGWVSWATWGVAWEIYLNTYLLDMGGFRSQASRISEMGAQLDFPGH